MLNIPQLVTSLLITISIHNVISVDIQCEFKTDDFDSIANQYSCEVQVNLMITSKNTAIQAVRGTHKGGKSIDDVTGLSSRDKIIQYVPVNFGEKFKNLIAIRIRQGKLKEIHQSDIKAYKNLKYLNLDANEIEVLDGDLFQFNPLLEVIWFESNRIKAIGQATFDNLKNLRDLDLNGNSCFSKRLRDKNAVASNLVQIRQKCYSPAWELADLKPKFQELKLKVSELELEKVELVAEISSKEEQLQNLTVYARDLAEKNSKNKEEFERKIEELEIQKNETVTKTELLEAKLIHATFENNKIIVQMKKLEEKFQKSLNESLENEQKYQKEIEKIQTELKEKEEKLEELTENLHESQLLANKTQKHLSELEEKLENLKEIEAELKQNATELEEKLETREIDFENITNILSSNSVKILTYEQEVKHLQLKINETASKFAAIDTQRLELSTELKNVSTEKQKLEINLKNLTKQLQKSEEELQNLLILNDELSNELTNQTQIAEALVHKVENFHPNGNTFMIVGLAVMVFLTIINIVVALKFYTKKTVILRQIEIEDSYGDEMME